MTGRLAPLSVLSFTALLCGPAVAETPAPTMNLLDVSSASTATPTTAAGASTLTTATNALGLPVATADAIKAMLHDNAAQRAHMWSIYAKLFEPIPGGAARFETFVPSGVTFSDQDISAVRQPTSGAAGVADPANLRVLFDPTAHQHVRDNRLHLHSTLDALATRGDVDPARDGAHKIPDFPSSAIVLKVVFAPLGSDADKRTHYWYTDKSGQSFMLVAMHCTTREQPSWTWATLYAPRTDGEKLSQGRKLDDMPADVRDALAAYEHRTSGGDVMKGVFTNYVMDTGFDYYDKDGDTSESNERACFNPYLETNGSVGPRFAHSNCISCHDQAKHQFDYDPIAMVDAQGNPTKGDDDGAVRLTDDNRPRTRVAGHTPKDHFSYRGAVSTDFLWSVAMESR